MLKAILTMNSNILKLNADKTELILFTSLTNEKNIETITVNIGNTEIKPSEFVRNLGAFLDSKMNMDKHINTVCRSGYMQLRQIGHIRKYLTTDAKKSFITKTYLYNIDPLKPHFYIVKLELIEVYINFLISAQKHRSARRL